MDVDAIEADALPTPAERLFEAARDGDVAALDALLPDATAEQLHEEHRYETEHGISTLGTPVFAAVWGWA